jgi:hypothetical protein
MSYIALPMRSLRVRATRVRSFFSQRQRGSFLVNHETGTGASVVFRALPAAVP